MSQRAEDKIGSTFHAGWKSHWTWFFPVAGLLYLALKYTGSIETSGLAATLLSVVLLGGSIFAAVHHAEVIARRVGEPFGSIVLAGSVTIIEVALIVSIMLTAADGGATVARDTVFAAIMIAMNGIIGLCLLVGGARHYEQGFKIQGTGAGLGVIGTLATLVLILPNYTLAVPGPIYADPQLIFVAIVSLSLYLLFLFVQTVRHRDFFLDVAAPDVQHTRPTTRSTLLSLLLLVASLSGVVLLAKTLSPVIERAVDSAGLPPAFVGVVIASVVLLPEGLSALRAARANRLQTSLNLSLGSALATIGLTIPVVAVVSLTLNIPLALGLRPEHIVLLVLTLFMSTLTLATGRTTVLQGGVHLVIFGAFMVIAAVP